MIAQDKIEQQFATLLQKGEAIKKNAKMRDYSSGPVIAVPNTVMFFDGNSARVWTMNSLSLVRSVFGTDSDYYSEIKRMLTICENYENFVVILSCVESALESLRNGYLLDTKALVEAELAADYLGQSKQLIDAGYKDAAAVICGSVLERHLRGMCDAHGISTVREKGGPMKINELSDVLAREKIISSLKKKQITAWADIRNQSAHGNYSKYSTEDVDSMLRDVTLFCANYM